MFAVMSLSKKMGVQVANIAPPLEQEVSLSWADGMIGAIPVFSTREGAEEYADGVDVLEIQEAK